MKKIILFPRLSMAAALAVLALAGAGCHSAPDHRDLMKEDLQAGERPVSIRGESAFLDGKLTATATVSRGFGHGLGKAGRGGKGGSYDARRDDVGVNEVYHGGDSEEEQKEAMAEYIRVVLAHRAAGSPMPPVTLRVK